MLHILNCSRTNTYSLQRKCSELYKLVLCHPWHPSTTSCRHPTVLGMSACLACKRQNLSTWTVFQIIQKGIRGFVLILNYLIIEDKADSLFHHCDIKTESFVNTLGSPSYAWFQGKLFCYWLALKMKWLNAN